MGVVDAFPIDKQRRIARRRKLGAIAASHVHLYPVIVEVLEILLGLFQSAFGRSIANRDPFIL